MKSLALLAVVLVATFAGAKDKYAPLPEQITSAKTVFIDNQTGRGSDATDYAYQELRKWKRYTVVKKAEDADIVIQLTTAYTGAETVVSGGQSTATTNANSSIYGNTIYGNATTSVDSSPVYVNTYETGATTLTVVDPKSGAYLWSITRAWQYPSATKLCIKELRKRVEAK